MYGPMTEVVNGQRITLPQGYQFQPQGYGPGTIGVPLAAPTIPPVVGISGSGSSAAAAFRAHLDGPQPIQYRR